MALPIPSPQRARCFLLYNQLGPGGIHFKASLLIIALRVSQDNFNFSSVWTGSREFLVIGWCLGWIGMFASPQSACQV